MRAKARGALFELHILCVEDLSAISEQELMTTEAIGAKTVNRLREALTRIGLDFLPNPMGQATTFEGSRTVSITPPRQKL